MVYGLDNEMNCDRLFNLFCLYGNVVRVSNWNFMNGRSYFINLQFCSKREELFNKFVVLQ
jgi:hypothetical protein